jgi:hypothetical protein
VGERARTEKEGRAMEELSSAWTARVLRRARKVERMGVRVSSDLAVTQCWSREGGGLSTLDSAQRRG